MNMIRNIGLTILVFIFLLLATICIPLLILFAVIAGILVVIYIMVEEYFEERKNNE